MLKSLTVIVFGYFGKLENNKSSIFGPATIFWTRDSDTHRLDYLFATLIVPDFLCPTS